MVVVALSGGMALVCSVAPTPPPSPAEPRQMPASSRAPSVRRTLLSAEHFRDGMRSECTAGLECLPQDRVKHAFSAVPVRISKTYRRHGREPAATQSMSPGAKLPNHPAPHPGVPDSLGASLLWPRLWGTVVSTRPSHRHSRPRACLTACVCPCDGARAALGADPGVSTWRQDGLVRGGGGGDSVQHSRPCRRSFLRSDATPARPFYYGIISATALRELRHWSTPLLRTVCCFFLPSVSGARSRWRTRPRSCPPSVHQNGKNSVCRQKTVFVAHSSTGRSRCSAGLPTH